MSRVLGGFLQIESAAEYVEEVKHERRHLRLDSFVVEEKIVVGLDGIAQVAYHVVDFL